MKLPKIISNKLLIGRHECIALPDLAVPAIKAKIDTGAKTSAIHAFNIQCKKIHSVDYVLFDIHPLQHNDKFIINCKAPIKDSRYIMSSNGHKEKRFIIETRLQILDYAWKIEVSLSNRDPLRFRFLIGLEALKDRVIIDPSLAYHQKKMPREAMMTLYGLDIV